MIFIADLYLSTYQYKYFNAFNYYDYYFEFGLEYETEPILSNGEIVSWSFKPIVNWIVADDELNSGYIRSSDGYPLTFIYTVEEIEYSMLNGTVLLDCELDWTNNGYTVSFRFYDATIDDYFYSREISFLNYDLRYFESGEVFENPYSDYERYVYLQNLYDEVKLENENLVIEIENLESSINAPHSTFALFSEAFKPVLNVLTLELAPNITLGMILCVPIVAGILSFILKETTK